MTLRFPQGTETPSYLTGGQRWRWTAHFETFVSTFDLGDRPRATPAGTYRFAVEGERREGGQTVPYEIDVGRVRGQRRGAASRRRTCALRATARFPSRSDRGRRTRWRRRTRTIETQGGGPADPGRDRPGRLSRHLRDRRAIHRTSSAPRTAIRPLPPIHPSSSGSACAARSGRGSTPATSRRPR